MDDSYLLFPSVTKSLSRNFSVFVKNLLRDYKKFSEHLKATSELSQWSFMKFSQSFVKPCLLSQTKEV